MRLLANHDDFLKHDLEKPKLGNATYLSLQTQNEMTDVTEKKIMQSGPADEIKDAEIYSILVDEVTLHNTELMPPLCTRFDEKNQIIREELVELFTMTRITRQHDTIQGSFERPLRRHIQLQRSRLEWCK